MEPGIFSVPPVFIQTVTEPYILGAEDCIAGWRGAGLVVNNFGERAVGE